MLLIRAGQSSLWRGVSNVKALTSNTDLVYIDIHKSTMDDPNEVCNRWRGRIVSLHGLTPGFPKLSDATSERPPLFHPNCSHNYHALSPMQTKKAIEQELKHIFRIL